MSKLRSVPGQSGLAPHLLLEPKLYGNYDSHPEVSCHQFVAQASIPPRSLGLGLILQRCGVPLNGSIVLDVGCGAGYSSLQIAHESATALVIGVDIDRKLVAKARRLMRAQRCAVGAPEETSAGAAAEPPAVNTLPSTAESVADGSHHSMRMPLSLPLDHGPLISPVATPQTGTSRGGPAPPYSPPPCLFRMGDVLSPSHCDSYASASVDVVMALQVTKWLHMQGGDAGVLQFFRFALRLLKPGGALVLQPNRRGAYSAAAAGLGPVHVPIAPAAAPAAGGGGGSAWDPRRRPPHRDRGHAEQPPGKWPLRYDMHVPPEDFPKLLLQGVGFHSVRRVRLRGGGQAKGHPPVFVATKAAALNSPGYASPSPPAARGEHPVAAKRPRVGSAEAAVVAPPAATGAGAPATTAADTGRGAWRLGPKFAQQPQVPVKSRDGWGGEAM